MIQLEQILNKIREINNITNNALAEIQADRIIFELQCEWEKINE